MRYLFKKVVVKRVVTHFTPHCRGLAGCCKVQRGKNLSKAPPVGLEQAVELLEKTLSDAVGGNAGGNISVEQRDQIRGWADLYRRAGRICEELAK